MPIDYEIVQGDCIDSIAMKYGFFPDTLWNHGSNAGLKQVRKDPNVLFPGDKLFIPDIQIREVDKAVEKKHRFRRKGIPAKLHLRFLKPKDPPPPKEETASAGDESNYVDPDPAADAKLEMEPIANAAFRLVVDGVEITKGQTDGDGCVKISIPPDAQDGIFTFYPGTPKERVIPLSLGGMDPVDTIIGARKRLCNLGYACNTVNELTPELKDALASFQRDNDLKVTGELNDETKAKLKDKHGC
ncbi:MAG: peptidoglycan-binding protein [Chthoniobacteraceae bacterium]